MQWVKWVLGVIFLVCSWHQVQAAPAIVGGELYYTYLGNDKYAIQVIAYRDCSGNQLGFYPVAMTPDGGSTYYGDEGPSGGWDITPVCKRSCTKCTSPSCTFGFGIEKYIIDDTVDLSGFSQCVFRFSWTAGVRSSAITTGAASSSFYIEAMLDRCKTGDHSSARFLQAPRFILDKAYCTGFYENGKGEEGDSLIYEQVSPMTAAHTASSYSSGYGREEPIRYSGYPTKTWKASGCEGIRFDKFTGQLNFKPTKNEISVLVFQIHHYRKDSNGVYQNIGTVMREYKVTVADASGNRSPVFGTSSGTKSENVVVCQDEAADYIIAAYDPDIDDTVTITADQPLPGAIYDRKGKWAILKWVPDSSAVRDDPYEVILTAKDNACPMPGIAQQQYLIYVKKPFPQYKYTVSDSGCGRRYFSVSHDSGISFSYKWWIDGGPAGTVQNWMHKFPKNGNYIVQLQLGSASGCYRTLYETVSITNIPDYGAGPDTFTCKGDSLQLRAKGGIKYIWRDRDNTVSDKNIAIPYAKPHRFTRYYVDIMDSNGCWYTDSTSVNIFDFKVMLSTNTTIFKESRDSLMLKGVKIDGAKYRWWTKDEVLDTLNHFIYVKPPVKTIYYLTTTPFIGCPKTDSVIVTVDSVTADAGPSKTICLGQSVQLEASGGDSYKWYPSPDISDVNIRNPIVTPTKDQVYWVTVTKQGIIDQDGVVIKVINNGPLVVSPVTICPGDTARLNAKCGHVFSWTPDNRILEANSSSPRVFPLSNYTYKVRITDTATDAFADESVNLIIDKDCVWPGDANKDGFVNHFDLLHFGVGYGGIGPQRTAQSFYWKGLSVPDWNQVSGDGINFKHFDLNGDGKINIVDTAAYRLYYGRGSAKKYYGNNGHPRFYFRFEKDTFYAGDLVKADLFMSEPNPGYYGIGLTYQFTNKRIVPGTYKFSFADRPANYDLKTHRTDGNTGEAAIVGTNHRNAFKEGRIASLEFQLQDSSYFAWPSEKYELEIMERLVIDSAGYTAGADVGNASMLVLRKRTSGAVNENSELGRLISIYPNPASSSVYVSTDGIEIIGVILTDMLGRKVYESLGIKERFMTISTSGIPMGIYLVKVNTEKGAFQQKLVIRR